MNAATFYDKLSITSTIIEVLPPLIGLIFLYSYGLHVWRQVGILLTVYTPFPSTSHDDISVQMGYSVGSVIFFAIVRHLYLYTRLKKTAQQLLIEKQQAELNYLKSQTNPHFLFNTLNNIYSLARDKSDLAPESILRLSKILRYMLYESNDNKVELNRELQYLQNYIDLQKIRFGNKAFVDFKITGEVGDQKIVPLLLIAFIENAFKHGVANDPSSPICLRINLDGKRLHFYMENKKHTMNRDLEGGIGLNNVKRRLDLLYPGKYTLNIQDEDQTYTCELSLVL